MTALASNKRRLKCPVCERTVERQSRTQVYCSSKCMRKGNYARKAGSGELAGQDTALIRTPHKFVSENNILQWPKTESSLSFKGPLNVLGGGSWRWGSALQIDTKTLAKVRWSEVGGDLMDPAK